MSTPDDSGGVTCSLSDLAQGDAAQLERLDLAPDLAERLMEIGFVPGTQVRVARSAPGGDPRVYRVDGVEIALRRETAACLIVRPECPLLEGA